MAASLSNKEDKLAPFMLSNKHDYQNWRIEKLANYPDSAEKLLVEIRDPLTLSLDEKTALITRLDKTNMCLYQLSEPDKINKATIKTFAAQLGYKRLDSNICADVDGISSLQTKDSGRHVGYIPYSNKKLSWHTDGYYNQPENTIRGMLLHCVSSALVGGENHYLDPEILYIHLRDLNPEYINALMDVTALTIPANEEAGVERAEQTGPVFSLDKQTSSLHLRYTARSRSIKWANNPVLLKALEEITQYLRSDSLYILKYKLKAGQGILCNNVLHNRTAFKDDDSANRMENKRLIYRARYYDRADVS